VHQTELASSQTFGHPPTEQYIQAQGGPQNRGAMQRLAVLVESQSAVESYADTSRWVAVITLGLAPLVLLLRRPRIGTALSE
jgi:hypothetical protein